MSFDIVNRYTRALVYHSATANTVSEAALEALRADADLGGADLRGANLRGADLRGANLRGADLRGADLTGANLRGANLRGADLMDANLTGADLRGADLRGADLRGANLADADLTDADLRGADLRGADLRGANLADADLTDADLADANLTPIRDDFWAVIASAPTEIAALRDALISGKVDGSTYSGECACLVGTIANARHCSYDQIPGLTPDGGRPAERFFLAIRPGDTPENSQHAKLAVEWLDDFVTRQRAAFGPEATHATH